MRTGLAPGAAGKGGSGAVLSVGPATVKGLSGCGVAKTSPASDAALPLDFLLDCSERELRLLRSKSTRPMDRVDAVAPLFAE